MTAALAAQLRQPVREVARADVEGARHVAARIGVARINGEDDGRRRPGERGGEVVFAGQPAAMTAARGSITAEFLSGRRSIPVPAGRRRPLPGLTLRVRGATANNLKGLDVELPLGCFVAVTGVSGSGKSTLVEEVLYRGLKKRRGEPVGVAGACRAIEGAERIADVILVDQAPIGSTPRANAVTYLRAFDPIRACFARTEEARLRGYTAATFSFNVPGGRCETCEGDGAQKLEMYFFEDVYVSCSACEGKRYRSDVLQVKYRGRTIADVLQMTVDEATEFFAAQTPLARRLRVLQEVGLGYLRLGQPANTFSGGEAQRIKLCAELATRPRAHMIYVLDEPTTGLHFGDVKKLLEVLDRLVESGNTVLVIEHNLDVVKTADWIVDLGPEGGDGGGEIVAAGPPEEMAAHGTSYTGRFLAEVLGTLPLEMVGAGRDA